LCGLWSFSRPSQEQFARILRQKDVRDSEAKPDAVPGEAGHHSEMKPDTVPK
jgi:hypothetical protein